MARLCGYLTILITLVCPSLVAAQSVDPAAIHQADVSEQLATQLAEANAPVSFLAVLEDQPNAEQMVQAATLRDGNRTQRNALLYAQLTAHAQRTQAPLRAWLDAQGIAYTPFYLVNMLEIKGDASLVESLRHRPEINRLIANPRINNLHELSASPQRSPFKVQRLARAESTPATGLADSASLELSPMTPYAPAIPYGLTYTHADALWAEGITGKGIIIGSQDTGIEWDHPAFKLQYRGWITATNTVTHTYNWFDAGDLTGTDPGFGRPAYCSPDPAVPCDDQGHGTHTVGTMVGDATAAGDTVLGMAPGAQWIGCRNMEGGVGTPASYTACFEFFLAPYPQGGDKFTQGRPELAPHVINNSWGCPRSEGCDVNSLQQIVETMRTAEILVVASASNNGPACSTVQDPIAIYDAVFSVGAHDSNGNIASFSSRGVVKKDGSNRLKPEISAPGVSVRSARLGWRTSSAPFNDVKQGTSMAAPHVTGAVALLWSAVPKLIGNIDLTEQILIKSATPVPFNQCGEGTSPTTPNNTYGFGRLNIQKAIELAKAATSLTVTVQACNGTFLTGNNSTLTDAYTGFRYTAITSTVGTAVIPIMQFPTIYPGAANRFVFTLPIPTGAASPSNFTFPITLTEGEPSTRELQVQCQFFPVISQ